MAPCSVNQQPDVAGNGAKQPVHVNISVSAQSQPVEVIRYSTNGECQCLLRSASVASKPSAVGRFAALPKNTQESCAFVVDTSLTVNAHPILT